MFLKKFRDDRKQKAANARQQIVDGFQARIDAANALTDPAAKVLELNRIGAQLDDTREKEQKAIRAQGSDVSLFASLGIAMPTFGAGAAIILATAIAPPFMLLVAVPTMIGSLMAGEKVKENYIARRTETETPFFAALQEKRDATTAAVDALVRDNLETLVTSASFDSLRAQPSLQDAFMKAIQHRVTTEAAPAAPQTKPDNGLSL